jgi:hypothetical protein
MRQGCEIFETRRQSPTYPNLKIDTLRVREDAGSHDTPFQNNLGNGLPYLSSLPASSPCKGSLHIWRVH